MACLINAVPHVLVERFFLGLFNDWQFVYFYEGKSKIQRKQHQHKSHTLFWASMLFSSLCLDKMCSWFPTMRKKAVCVAKEASEAVKMKYFLRMEHVVKQLGLGIKMGKNTIHRFSELIHSVLYTFFLWWWLSGQVVVWVKVVGVWECFLRAPKKS